MWCINGPPTAKSWHTTLKNVPCGYHLNQQKGGNLRVKRKPDLVLVGINRRQKSRKKEVRNQANKLNLLCFHPS